MGTTILDYDILISVDAGYNESKVTVNGLRFSVPANIVDITDRDKYIGDIRKEGFICSSYVNGFKHLVGEQAQMLLRESEYKRRQESKKDIMESYDKFTTQDSTTHLMTCIGMALIKYSEYTKEHHIKPEYDVRKKNNQFNIYVILGYPHEVYQQVFKVVKPLITKEHNFTIETEYDIFDVNFEIKSSNIMTYSQALALYMGLISDDNGNVDYQSDYFKQLPCLVGDGGQKTFGEYKITSNLQIESAESNTEYAMNNIYERVVNEIRTKYKRMDIEIYNIQDLLEHENGILTYLDDTTDSTDYIDIKELVEKFRAEVCEEWIAHINEKFNRLLDLKQIVLGGGTGAAFYADVVDYINEHRQNLKGKVVLASYDFMGEKIEPKYAISVGLYKVLKQAVKVAKEEDEHQNNE